MKPDTTYETYPAWIIILSNLFALLIYFMGVVIMSRFGIIWSLAFVCYFLFIEFRLLQKACVDCYYNGRGCAFGKGWLCSLLFKKGDPVRFARREARWKTILPDLLVFMIPLAGGVILLIRDFSWHMLALVLAMAVLYGAGNAFIRGKLACACCKQRECGCPADKLFNRGNPHAKN